MEHPCYRCQASIEEGTTFCPHCGAPQIRVILPEENLPAAPPLPPIAPSEISPPAYSVGPGPGWTQGGTPYAPEGSAIQWNQAWQGALLAGVGAAVLSAIPFVSIGCCLWMLAAGVLSVAMYRKRMPGVVITPGMGRKVGALTGVIGFMLNAVFAVLSFAVFRSVDFRRAMQEQMQKQMASNPDPKAQEIVQHFLDWMATPQGMATFMVLLLIVLGVVFVAITAAGGALGASMTGQRREFR